MLHAPDPQSARNFKRLVIFTVIMLALSAGVMAYVEGSLIKGVYIVGAIACCAFVYFAFSVITFRDKLGLGKKGSGSLRRLLRKRKE